MKAHFFHRLFVPVALVAIQWGVHSSLAQGPAPFRRTTLTPAFELNGAGSDVDSIAFWEAPDPADTLMFVTGKANNRLEVWKYPFQNNEQSAIQFPTRVNGVVVDQETDTLYVSDFIVSVLSVPDLQLQSTFGSGIIGVGENNLDILKHSDGRTIIYVSDDHNVYRFDAADHSLLGSFAPPVSSIETLIADDFYQTIHVPEEQGPEGNPGIYVYDPDGVPFLQNATNLYGEIAIRLLFKPKIFDSDEEGILLYTFPMSGIGDNGTGFIVVSDQRADITEFEFFDRQTWSHLGSLRLTGVSNTDGIASTQRALPAYPLGVFAAINDDSTTAMLGWDAIFTELGWDMAPETVSITPTNASVGSAEFAVVFSEPVTNFNDAGDLVVMENGIASSGVSISGSGANYVVSISGITGVGSLSVAVSLASDVQDATSNALAASVTSLPVSFGSTPYQLWAVTAGLTIGVNDGFDEDPDGDGCRNLKEFATDGNPLSGPDGEKQDLAIDETGGTQKFNYTLPIRQDAVFTGKNSQTASIDGITYHLAGSVDLLGWSQGVVEIVPALDFDLPALNPGWNYRSFQLAGSVDEELIGFLRLSVTTEQP